MDILTESARKWALFLLTPALLGAVVVYGYEWGAAAALHYPPAYIHVQFSQLLQLPFYVLFLLAIAGVPLACWSSVSVPKTSKEKVIRFWATLSVPFATAMLVTPGHADQMSVMLLCATFGLVSLIFLNWADVARLLRGRLRGTWLGELMVTTPPRSLISTIPPSILALYAGLYFVLASTYAQGYSDAARQRVFSVIESDPPEIVLRRFGDLVLTARFYPVSKNVYSAFTERRLDSTNPPTLVDMYIGKVSVRPFHS